MLFMLGITNNLTKELQLSVDVSAQGLNIQLGIEKKKKGTQ